MSKKSKKSKKPKIKYVKWLPRSAWGITLPPYGIFILEKHRNNRSLKAHELWHWRRYLQWGAIKFYWRAITQYIIYGYRKSPIELEAPPVEPK